MTATEAASVLFVGDWTASAPEYSLFGSSYRLRVFHSGCGLRIERFRQRITGSVEPAIDADLLPLRRLSGVGFVCVGIAEFPAPGGELLLTLDRRGPALVCDEAERRPEGEYSRIELARTGNAIPVLDPTVDFRSVESLQLSVRATNCLEFAGVNRIGELRQLSVAELMLVRNLGQRQVDEVLAALAGLGITLPG